MAGGTLWERKGNSTIAAVFSQENGLAPCWLRQVGALHHCATLVLKRHAGWASGQEQRRDLGSSPTAAGLFLASEVFGPRHWISLPGWFVLKSLLLLIQQNLG